MARLDRFLKLEGKRPTRPSAEGPAQHPRFADVGGASENLGAPQRTGGAPERFSAAAEPPAEPPLRLREDDGGQPFVRCRLCRYDNSLGARTCVFCDADLTTPAQRSFNEDLWERTEAERAEYKRETDRLEAEQQRVNVAHSAAMRELARMRLGQIRWRGDVSLFGALLDALRGAGTAIARGLVRRFPDRRERLFVLFGFLVISNLLTLSWALDRGWGLTFWWLGLGLQLVAVSSAFYRARSR